MNNAAFPRLDGSAERRYSNQIASRVVVGGIVNFIDDRLNLRILGGCKSAVLPR